MTNSRFWRNLHPLIRRERKPLYEDDTNYAILNAIDKELEDLEEETFKSKIQSSLKTATGMFLDEYGDFFNVYRRRDEEEDEPYRERIIEALNIPRGTNESIKMAIRRYLEDNTIGINVYEPWTEIFYLNDPKSRLNGLHKMQGEYYHFAVIDVYIGSPFGEDIVSLINDFKPAGVTLHTTYDPSLRPVDVSEEDGWGAVPYTQTYASNFENTLDMFTSLNQPLQGTIRLSDTKVLNDIFDLNRSELSGLDVLSGSYGVHNELLHLVGIASGFNPDEDTLMKDVTLNMKLMEETFYRDRDEVNKNQISVELRPTKQLYVTLNIDTLAEMKYPGLNRFEGDYEKLINESSIQTSVKTERGLQVKLQVYDFVSKSWVDISRRIADNKLGIMKAKLKGNKKYLNDNQLMFLRVTVPKDTSVEFNHFRLDYRSEVATSELGYNVGMLPSHPLIENV